jgi:hypothetical protein
MKFLIFAISMPYLLSSFAHANCIEDVFETIISKTSFQSAKNPVGGVIKESNSGVMYLSNKLWGASLRQNISKRGEHAINIESKGGVVYQLLFDASCKLVIEPNKDRSSYSWVNSSEGTFFSTLGLKFPFTTIDKCYEDAGTDMTFFCESLEDKDLKSIFEKSGVARDTEDTEGLTVSRQ